MDLRSSSLPRSLFVGLVIAASLPSCNAADVGDADISPAARLAAASLRLGDGFHATAVASEPLLSNPVAFCFDPAGRIFVAETHRIKHGTEDNRDHMDWLDDDLAARTVDDRREYIKRRMGDRIGWFTEMSELIRLVEDKNGDGTYDSSSVYAEDFRDIAAGAAAGVMWNGDRLLVTCIPALWELRDADGDGHADQKRALADGFGVHCALFGHDLHGLCVGPDGLIYFSIGDRGLQVTTPDGVLSNPDSGAVLRCRPDGSHLELFATGLRNPQELAFNEYGDLFTVDNNSDIGDRARVVHIVEGMKVGWRMSYQYLPDRGPFMRERIWEPQNDAQPAEIVPPIANLTDGPSGLVHYPGTGLPAAHAGAFFVCDFLGASGRSGVREFHLEPAGAGYRLTRDSMFAQGVLATDCDFGPDGNLYISDWLEGWTGTGMGRIYRVASDDPQANAELAALRDALTSITAADDDRLLELLGHADMRVRSAAQSRLVTRGDAVASQLAALAGQGGAPQLARIHAIWALTSLAQGDAQRLQELLPLCKDADAEIRNQAARALGTANDQVSGASGEAIGTALVALLSDSSPRVQSSAAIAVGKIKYAPALTGLLKLASDNADRDPIVRHAASFGLAGSQTPEALLAAAAGASVPERTAIAVALGRLKSPLVAKLLNDESERVALEAARAIWDTPIETAYADLAAAVDGQHAASEPLVRRALAACLATGGDDKFAAVVRCGLRQDVSPAIRSLAWQSIGQWSTPSPRDPVHGSWRPVAPRPAEQTLAALKSLWPTIEKSAAVDPTGVIVAAEVGLPDAFAALLQFVGQESSPADLRARAVAALAGAQESIARDAVQAALESTNPDVRIAARRLLVKRFPDRVLAALLAVNDEATVAERQEAIQLLAGLDAPAARAAIAGWLERVEEGDCPPELVLDVLEAAAGATDQSLVARQAKFKQQLAAQDPPAEFSMCLEGGDPLRGAEVFLTNQTLACRRCHSLKPDLQQVGPTLYDIGTKRTRAELLESIVRPNAKIVEGFQTTSMLLDTGMAVSGVLRRENDTHAVLADAEGKEIVVELATVEERSQGLSAMPEGLTQNMTPRNLRDLVAYLSTLKAAAAAATPASGHGGTSAASAASSVDADEASSN